ncbi:MAG: tetratricopeptide repeat protein [Tildeniella nuda ZEHNDER 1965/U140]|jgi:CHAT domain-containing protein/Flp pilus assembly protein TadD|nr:tetratricopeptide repeat protein [Tildeniella nuda ZEHNDER 1965/U140]
MRPRLTAGLVMTTLLWVMPPLLVASQAAHPVLAQTIQERRAEATRLNNEGRQLRQKGQYRVALTKYQQALAITRAIKERQGEGAIINNIGLVYQGLGQYPKALETFQQALVILKEAKNRSGEGLTLNNIGEAYRNLGQYPKALETFQQALTIHREVENRPVEGTTLSNIGEVYRNLGQYPKALETFQQVLTIHREVENRPEEGTTLNNIGAVYHSLGQYPKALETYQQALTIHREVKNRPVEGTTLNNIGEVYRNLGQYPKALETYQQALTIHREVKNRPVEGTTLSNIGAVYHSLGQYPKALETYQQALAILREVKNRPGEGVILNNIGEVYRNLGQYPKALETYQQALAIHREVQNRPEEGTTLNNIGIVHHGLEQYAKALETYQQALAIHREVQNRPEEGTTLNNIGEVYRSLGQYPKALETYQQALAIHREVQNRPVEGATLNNIGISLLQVGSFPIAEKSLFEAIDTLESLRPGLSDANKITFFETLPQSYSLLQQALIAQNKTQAALEISERGRAKALIELLASRLNADTSDKAVNNQLLTTNGLAVGKPTIAQIQQIAKTQNATLVQYSIIQDGFKVQGKKEWREVTLYIWAVSPAGTITFRKADLTSLKTPLDQLVIRSREAIGVRGRGERTDIIVSQTPEALKQRQEQQSRNLKELHKLLIEPIADLLPKDPNDRVIFVPQGALFLVPFPALQAANGTYLIEQHTILTAPAIQALELTHQKAMAQRSKQATKGTALVVGNPIMPNVTFKVGDLPVRLTNLPGAKDEAIAIAQLLNTQPILGQQATKAEVVRQMASARIIHLATHGLLDTFKGETPGAIALGPSGNGEINDGLLTSGEIFDMKLNAELVVLSACDTGRGDLTGDGVIGLSRTLFIAGVPSVIVSLWSVPDAPTAQLMSQFYRNLQQPSTNKAQALRQAMLATMKTHPNPIDWAAFTLSGEAD